jgi:hypothetical protein
MSQVAEYRPSQEEVNQLNAQVEKFCVSGTLCRNHLQGLCRWVHPETILRDPTLSHWVKYKLWSLAKTHPAEPEQSVQWMGPKPSRRDEWHNRLPEQVRAIVTAAGGVAPPGHGPTAPALVSGGLIVASPAPGPGGQAATSGPTEDDLEELQGLVSRFCTHAVHCHCRTSLCGDLHPSSLVDYPLRSQWVRLKAMELFDMYPFRKLTQEQYKARMGTVEVEKAEWLPKVRDKVKKMREAAALLRAEVRHPWD